MRLQSSISFLIVKQKGKEQERVLNIKINNLLRSIEYT